MFTGLTINRATDLWGNFLHRKRRRAFRPHVTLGRAARDARPRDFTGLEAMLAGTDFAETVSVDEVDLMESTLKPEGPVYQVKYHERLS